MPPATRSAEREEERRLNMRTLTIASVASATAAAVTSQLWIAGTWVAAAVTPVLVTLVSEALHRPTERLAQAWTSDQPALRTRAARPREAVAAPHGDPLRPRDGETRPAAPPLTEPVATGPVRVYRQPSARAPRRRVALGAVAATVAIAFTVAVAALTAGDLLSGGSIGKGAGRTTFFGGHAKEKQREDGDAAPQRTAPDQTDTTPDEPTVTETTPEETEPSGTAPTTPPAPTQTEPTPDAVP
jgi:hypothetical protein